MFRDWTVREWTRQSIKEVIRNVYENMSIACDSFSISGASFSYSHPCTFQYYGGSGSNIGLSKVLGYQEQSSTALTSLSGSWYPLDVIPLFEIQMANTLKAEDLQFETQDYKLVKKLLHFTGIVKPSNFPANYPLPTSCDLECLILYTSKFNVTNGYYVPVDGSLYNYDTGIPKIRPRHNKKVDFTFNNLITNQFYNCKYHNKSIFDYYPASVSHSQGSVLPIQGNMEYRIDDIINMNNNSGVDSAYIALPRNFAIHGWDVNDYFDIYARLFGYIPSGITPTPTRQVSFNSPDLIQSTGNPTNYYMSLTTDDFILQPNAQNPNDAHCLTQGSISFFRGGITYNSQRPPVMANTIGSQIQTVSAEWLETYTY